MKKFIKEYLKFKDTWEKENLNKNSEANCNDEVVLVAFKIYLNENNSAPKKKTTHEVNE